MASRTVTQTRVRAVRGVQSLKARTSDSPNPSVGASRAKHRYTGSIPTVPPSDSRNPLRLQHFRSGPVKSWLKFVSLSGGFLMWDIWGWLRRFAAERRRVSEPERSREAAQPTGRSRPVLTLLPVLPSTDSCRQAVRLLRGAVSQRRVGPAGVVQIDRLVHCQPRLRLGFEQM